MRRIGQKQIIKKLISLLKTDEHKRFNYFCLSNNYITFIPYNHFLVIFVLEGE